MDIAIAPLTDTPVLRAGLRDMLVEAVAQGGSVGFMHPLAAGEADDFWNGALSAAARGERIILGAFDGAALVGSVTLQLACPPNQPHRGEIAKMMTRPSHRRRGVAAALLRQAERLARERGKTLLVLDTAAEDGAAGLYETMGYRLSGLIPDYAFRPLGGLTGTLVYWKRLDEDETPRGARHGAVIRAATDGDLPGILEIYNHAVRHSTAIWNDTVADLDNRRAWFDARRARGYPVLVAEQDARIAGYAAFGDFRPYDGYRHCVEHSVYVAEDARRQGLAADLVRALFAPAKAAGKEIMIGAIAAENTASLRLHAALGFAQTGRMPRVGMKFGRHLDLVWMQKTL